jgi:uncharacterized protein (TIGR02996 family)
MTDDAFVRAILAHPEDEATRLVYADWLEEQGDPRGEVVRLDIEMFHLSGEVWQRLRTRQEELLPGVSPVWQVLVLRSLNVPVLPPRTSVCLTGGPGTGPSGHAFVCPNTTCCAGNPPSARHCRRCCYPLPLVPGAVVAGRYRIEEELALRGLGYVYRAAHLRAERSVVLKELTGADAADFSYLLPVFRQETANWTTVQSSPITPRLHEVIEEERAAYLVLEDVGRQTLAEIQRNDVNWSFSFERVVEVGKQLCGLLELMHGQEPPLLCVHLDQDHLYVSPDRRSVKVLVGFFATHWVQWLLRNLQERMRGVGLRMPCFAFLDQPPERVIGKPEPRSDLYSLAGILFQLLTGRPFDGGVTRKELEEHLAAENCPIPAGQRWLYELIAVNLSEDPRDRYPSAKEVRADLERHAP